MIIRNVIVHHPTPTYYPSTIDLVLINNLHNISFVTTTKKLTSDHLPIHFNIELSEVDRNRSNLNTRYDLANWPKFQQTLNQQIQLDSLSLISTVDIYNNFKALTMNLFVLQYHCKEVKQNIN